MRAAEYGITISGIGAYLVAATQHTDTLSTAISNSSFTFEKYFRGLQIAKSGVIDLEGATIAAAGKMAAFEASAKAAGFESATAAMRTFTGQLAEIPGITDKDAAAIEAMLATIPNSSAHVNGILVSLIQTLAKTGDEAVAAGTKISEAFKGSESGPRDLAEILLKTKSALDLRTLSSGFMEGFGDAAKSAKMLNDAINATLIAQQEVDRKLREQLDSYGRFGGLVESLSSGVRSELNSQIDVNNELQKRLDFLTTIKSAQDAIAAAAAQSDAADKIVKALNLSVDQAGSYRQQLDLLEKEKSLLDNMKEPLDDEQVTRARDLEAAIEQIRIKLLEARQAAAGITGTIPAQLDIIHQKLRDIETEKSKITANDGGIFSADQLAILDGLNQKMRELGASEQALNDKLAGGTVYERESLNLTLSRNEAVARQQLQPAFEAAAAATGIRKEILEAIARQESRFGTADTNGQGVMQITAATAAHPGFGVSPIAAGDIQDAAKNIMFAAEYLKARAVAAGATDLNDPAQRNKALAAYNGGGDPNYVANVSRFLPGGGGAPQGGAGGALDPLAQLEAQKKRDEQERAAAGESAENRIALAQKVATDETAILNQKEARIKAAGQLEVANAAEDKQKLLALAQVEYEHEVGLYGEKSSQAISAQAAVVRAQHAVNAEEQANAASDENAKFQVRLRGINDRIAALRQEAAASTITRQKELSNVNAELDQELSLEKDHYAKLQSIYADNIQKFTLYKNKLLEIEEQIGIKRSSEERKTDQQIAAAQKQAADSASQTLGQAVTGMITHQTTLRDAARTIATQMLSTYVNLGVRMVLNNSGVIGKIVAETVTGEGLRTTAVVQGTVARTSAETTGGLAAGASTIAAVLKSIKASAAETFAGIFGFLSPVLGPLAAVPAAAGAATVGAAAGLIGGFETGAWSLPADMLAMVHKGEMVVPAGVAPFAQGLLSGAANTAGGNTVHIHVTHAPVINAVDAHSIREFYNSSERVLLRQLNDAVKRGAHIGLSHLGAR